MLKRSSFQQQVHMRSLHGILCSVNKRKLYFIYSFCPLCLNASNGIVSIRNSRLLSHLYKSPSARKVSPTNYMFSSCVFTQKHKTRQIHSKKIPETTLGRLICPSTLSVSAVLGFIPSWLHHQILGQSQSSLLPGLARGVH